MAGCVVVRRSCLRWALAMAEHVADNILIGVTRVALPMVHGHGADAQERFDGTDAILVVAQGNAPRSAQVPAICPPYSARAVPTARGHRRAGGDVFNIPQEGGGVFDDDISVIEVLFDDPRDAAAEELIRNCRRGHARHRAWDVLVEEDLWHGWHGQTTAELRTTS